MSRASGQTAARNRTAKVAAGISRQQMAFARAWAEGVDVALAYRRYVQAEGHADARRARRTLQQVMDALRALARARGRQDIAVLLRRDPEAIPDPTGSTPSIDEFRARQPEDFYTEAAERIAGALKAAGATLEVVPDASFLVVTSLSCSLGTASSSCSMIGDGRAILPAGYQESDLAGKPVRDGTSAQIGQIRAMAVDETSGAARAMVAFAPLFGQAAKVAAVEVEALVPATGGDGFSIQLTPVQIERMPAYAWDRDAWRRVEG